MRSDLKSRFALCLLIGLILPLQALAGDGKSALQAYLNPFGDPWSESTGNPDIPLVGALECPRRLPEQFWSIAPEQLAFSAAFDAQFTWSECLSLLSPPDRVAPEFKAELLQQRIAKFKGEHAGERLLGYSTVAVFSSGAPGSTEIAKQHPEFFVSREGAAPSLDSAMRFGGARLLDITNPAFQKFIAAEVRDSLDAYDLDGMVIDGLFRDIEKRLPADELPDRIHFGWERGVYSLLAALKRAMGPDKLLLVNVNEADTEYVRGLLDVVDGVILEDPFGSLAIDLDKSGQISRLESAYDAAQAAGKIVVNVVNTNVNGTKFQTTNASQEHRFARYYAAAHLIFFRGPNTPMLYYTPSKIGPQFNSEVFFADWNLRVGKPDEEYETVRRGVYSRRFHNAIVYLNNSAQPYKLDLDPCCSFATPEGETVKSYDLPPKAGMIFMRKDS